MYKINSCYLPSPELHGVLIVVFVRVDFVSVSEVRVTVDVLFVEVLVEGIVVKITVAGAIMVVVVVVAVVFWVTVLVVDVVCFEFAFVLGWCM